MTRRHEQLLTWGTIAVQCCVWIYLGWTTLDSALYHDFLGLYTGGWMVAHGQSANLYSPAAQLAFQHDVLHTASGLIPYIRPPFYALLIAPLGLLSLRNAFIVWIAVQTGILLGCWIWGYRKFGRPALLIASLFMPAFLGIANGQDCVLLLALLIGSLALAEQEKPWLAGALLGAMLMKFHLVLLWPLALIWQRRWKMLGGFALAAAGEGILSLAIAGAGGIRDYVAILQNHSLENLSPSPEFMISVPGLLANLGIDSVAGSAIGAALVIAVWAIASRHAELMRLYALTSVAGLLLVAHAYGYDAAMLLLAIWLTFFLSAQRPARVSALLLATPFPFCLTLAGKPWAALSSISLLAFLAILASYRYQAIPEVGPGFQPAGAFQAPRLADRQGHNAAQKHGSPEGLAPLPLEPLVAGD